MRIGFIGAGKVSTAFGRYLREHGVVISGYHDRHPEKVANACEKTAGHPFADGNALAAASDMVLITTRDDQIQGVCESLCRSRAIDKRHLVGHMSGAHASLILDAAQQRGSAVFSLHPLQAFAEEQKALADLPNTYFSIEGTDSRLSAVEAVMKQVGNPFFRIRPENKQMYHLSACIFSNYLVTLMAAGISALAHSGVQPEEGFQAMLPLIQGTIANIGRLGPAKALTGPIARGDVSTLEQHLIALSGDGSAALRNFYALMGMKTVDLAEQDVLNDADKAAALRRLLAPHAS